MLSVELMCCEAYKSKAYAYEHESSLKVFGGVLFKLKSRLGIDKKGRAR
jgi:hypothetical protein